MDKSVAIIGAGLTGCVLAERFALAGCDVVVYEREAEIGGLCRDGYNDDGVFVQWCGPHIFHTDSREIWDYLSQFTGWVPYTHHVVAAVAVGDYVGYLPIPINAITLRWLDMSADEARKTLYDTYTAKMWGEYAEEVAAEVQGRVAVRGDTDCLWFDNDRWQGLPQLGYTRMMRRMLDAQSISVILNAEVNGACINTLCERFDAVCWTGRIDAPLDYQFGRLPYRSMRFEWGRMTDWQGQLPIDNPVVNYPDLSVSYIRRTCFPLDRNYAGRGLRAILHETPIPCGVDCMPTHPVPTVAARDLHRRYVVELAARWPNLTPVGRTAEMRYLDMGIAVANALDSAREILEALQEIKHEFRTDRRPAAAAKSAATDH